MSRPIRRYQFILAERLRMTIRELQEKLTLSELVEWLAFDLTQSQEWIEKYKKEKELAASKNLDGQNLKALAKKILGDRG